MPSSIVGLSRQASAQIGWPAFESDRQWVLIVVVVVVVVVVEVVIVQTPVVVIVVAVVVVEDHAEIVAEDQ